MKKKLLPSHSSSPSSSSLLSSSPSLSSSSLSFDPTMCTSKKATAGCLTGILRRILCSRGLPTHPSDQIRDLDSLPTNEDDQELKTKRKIAATADSSSSSTTATATLSAPGIVARLMGLESMVEIPSESSASSLSRSRSMNSVECYGECDRMQGIHRRVKSTLSFREVPGFLMLESDNFLVLSFEGKELESKRRVREIGSAELKQRRKLKENRRQKVPSGKILSDKEKQSRRVFDEISLRKNDGKLLREVTNTLPLSTFKVSSENNNIDSGAEKFEQVLNGKKLKRRRRRRKKKTSCNCTAKTTELECNSEELSPVSVLDFDRQVPASEVDSLGMNLSSRRKLSSELGSDQHFLLRFDGNLMIEQRKMKANEGSKRREKQREEYIDIWDEACRKAEDEFVGSNHIWKQGGDWECISEDFESEIFDHLLNELIHQLLVGLGNPIENL